MKVTYGSEVEKKFAVEEGFQSSAVLALPKITKEKQEMLCSLLSLFSCSSCCLVINGKSKTYIESRRFFRLNENGRFATEAICARVTLSLITSPLLCTFQGSIVCLFCLLILVTE